MYNTIYIYIYMKLLILGCQPSPQAPPQDSLAFVGAGRVHGIHGALCPSLLLGCWASGCSHI